MIGKILIIGGYGAVGRIISEHLSERYPEQVIVAGRSFAKAERLSVELQNHVIPSQLDLKTDFDSSILEDIVLVIMCIDQADSIIIEECLKRDIHYIDITADQKMIRRAEALKNKIKDSKSTVILSVGLAPGLTNLLAQHTLNTLGQIQETDIFILLGLGEKHGDSAYKWTFDNLNKAYPIVVNGETRIIKSFTSPKKTLLKGLRNFYLFNFSDQHTFLNTTPVRKVFTRMAFDSKLFTKIMALMTSLRLTSIFSYSGLQRLLIRLFHNLTIGSDIFGIKVVSRTPDQTEMCCTISGNGEGKITAYMATEVAHMVLKKALPAGIQHSHQVITDIPAFISSLKKYNNSLEVNL
ncbi:saccharopine dehydrogenase NADP-binding domain-containing protein [Sphingobacterium spiritivorum]|uniref:saccharopine dehydrogenase NADP-binding domain-containing protein n=1 Tax=Sphingobacterium spiritivorum TaxID=258 RepID=UPI003DA35604